ncbi:hypothetical protein B0T13DRAFT_63875 [Neurospora crassa]|nr:hypothetical protein B0T13DRAFT_63875 [Neurospora crassa]
MTKPPNRVHTESDTERCCRDAAIIMSGHPFFLIVVWLFLAVTRPEFLKGFRLPSDAVYLASGAPKKVIRTGHRTSPDPQTTTPFSTTSHCRIVVNRERRQWLDFQGDDDIGVQVRGIVRCIANLVFRFVTPMSGWLVVVVVVVGGVPSREK